MLAGVDYRLIIVHGEVFALLALQKLINVGYNRTDLADNKNVRAKPEDFLRDLAIDAIDEGHDGNDGGDSNYHTEQGQSERNLFAHRDCTAMRMASRVFMQGPCGYLLIRSRA